MTASVKQAAGKLVGVGVGPGDPELLTIKAVRALKEADVVAHFAKNGNRSRARTVVEEYLSPDIAELELRYPVTTEIPKSAPAYCRTLHHFYDECAQTIARHLDEGRRVAVICEGDPFFYGSYMHLHVRLAPQYPTDVVAGVTGMSGCWSAAGEPIAQGDDVFTVIPGTLPEPELERRLAESDAIVIMKLGRNLAKVRRALDRSGRLAKAIYVERGTMPEGLTMQLAAKADDHAPYWALVLVPGWEARR
jgi:precorrin-2/cobalt-factor-2 C20-methyltransferase